ncbi:guanine deaminase [Imleria badia]|nr:guanine deaminase [Imleria badia]
MTTIYSGPIINPQSLTSYRAHPACLIAVGQDGNILWIDTDVDTAIARHGVQSHTLVKLNPGEFIMPGLIDTHIHACQFQNLGVGGDLQLLDWLTTYTFPAESKFKDLDYAERIYTDVVQRVIASGTTTCCYYGSLHRDSTMRLADIVRQKGQRAFVGKCNMNWHCPDYYVEKSVQESISTTVDLIRYIQALPLSPAQEPLVHPVITPRFAISCTPELLAELGDLAEKMPNVAIQTHISENQKEVDDTLKYFSADSYAGVYDKFKLLRHNTILAHGVWLTEKEMDLIAERGAGLSHCPTSNFYLSSGMARVGLLLDHGVKVGLGSDVSGGYNPSILHAIQMASIASKMLAIQSESNKCGSGHEHDVHGHKEKRFANKKLGVETLLYLATKGGAEVCCLQDRIGSFEPGKAFDALLVSVRSESGNPAMWSSDLERDPSPESKLKQWLEQFLFCGDNRNIKKVIVQGAVIGGQDHKHE